MGKNDPKCLKSNILLANLTFFQTSQFKVIAIKFSVKNNILLYFWPPMINNCIATSYRLTILSYSRINNRCFFANTKNPSPWTCFIDCRSRGWMFYRSRIKFGMTAWMAVLRWGVDFLLTQETLSLSLSKGACMQEMTALRQAQGPCCDTRI